MPIVGCVNRLTLMLKDDFSASDSVVPIREQQSVNALSVEATAPENEHTGSKSTNTEDKFLLLLARAISQAKMPLIVSGLGLKSVELLIAIDDLMACLSQKSHGFSPELTIVAPECNSVGNLYLLNEQTLSIEQIIKRCASSSMSTNEESPSLLILEQDLAQLNKEQSQQLRHFCKTMIVLDHTHNALTAAADVVLPVACVSESNGHFVNFQGRLQRFSSVHVPVKPIMENWHWLGLLAKHLFNQQDVNFSSLSQLQSFFSKRGEPWALQVLTCQYQHKEQANEGTARQTPRSSGRTAMMANQSVHEVKTYNENSQNDILNYSMEGANASSTSNMPYTWSPAWNSNQSIFQYQQEVNGELINAGNENLLNLILSSYFEESSDESVATKLNELWPASSLVVADKLTVIQSIPWFLAEQQTRFLPEFILMFTSNTVSISTTFAKQHDIQASTILKVTIDEQDIFAKAKINNKLSEKIILVSLFELPLSSNNFSLAAENINKATTVEIAEFHQVELNRKQAAQQEKSDVLQRLKKQDQTIPIAFYDANAVKGGGNG